jgi:DNA-binding NtrC family response regulator
LRVIEEKTFERLGGVDTISFSSRIIAATNKDLQALVKEGKFREDLFYRLNVFRIDLPPLRERKEDIPGLIKLFIRSKRLTDDAYATLLRYDFPGNIRELSNIIESASIVARGNTIKAEDLPLLKREVSVGEGNGLKVEVENGFAQIETIKESLEKEILTEALKMYSNLPNDEIAKKLGTTRRVLEARIKHYNIIK